MIITTHGEKLWLVNQMDHAIHAGGVTEKWGNDKFEKPYMHESVSIAVGKHDIGWIEPDSEVLFDEEEGKAINFKDVNLKQHVEFYGKGYKKVLVEDQYAGLLVGMHWIGLYNSRFGYDPTFTYQAEKELVPFMDETIINQQKAWIELKEAMWDRSEPRSEFEDKIWMNYELVQVMDRMSLFMSMTDPLEKNEVTLGPVRTSLKGSNVNLTVKSLGDGRLLVDPFPLSEEFECKVKVRKITDKKYPNHKALLKALETSEEVFNTWKLVSSE